MSDAAITLDRAALHEPLLVTGVNSAGAPAEWMAWLADIGFVPGEQVMLMHRGIPGGDPLVVRVGLSTFALRRAEAACIQVARAQS